ncbi:cupin domain-containing protein [Methyloceanibacter sp.]|uniref:cupin domain-containing protein n=1 Tax=Methyloceanibacter sp. TaxID=1965321 RepID=UPI003D6D56D0
MPSSRNVMGGSASPFLETPQPPFGPAPPPLADSELPSLRSSFNDAKPKICNGGTAKEVTVAEFPVSDKLAGVYMTLDPGGLRELHWHANAAEWAYVIDGNCRVTTIDPQGQAEIVDFGPGDVWYFPRGHGHSIQGIGSGASTPDLLLATNFGVPVNVFAKMPNGEVVMPEET